MARIERFTTRVQADLACEMLRANGVDARVSSDDAGGLHPDIAYGIGGTVVVVPDDEFALANALLDEGTPASTGSGEEGPAVSRRGAGFRAATALVALTFLFLAVTGLIGLYRF